MSGDPHGAIGVGRQRFRRLVACWARPATWLPSRPGASSTWWTSGPMSSDLGAILCEVLTGEPAFARPQRRPRRSERQDEERWQRHGLASSACGADPELIGLAKDCLAPEREDRPRRAGVIVERITAHLSGVQERLRAAEVARAEEQATAPTRPRHGHGPSGSPGGWR